MKLIITIIGGLLFGAGLVISGMTDPSKVIGFLDFLGAWDPALAFVMGGALTVFGGGLLFLKKSEKRFCDTPLPDTSADPLSLRLTIGASLFGVGWGMSGFCPGPALANLTTLNTEVLVFIPFMILGMVLSQRLFSLDK